MRQISESKNGAVEKLNQRFEAGVRKNFFHVMAEEDSGDKSGKRFQTADGPLRRPKGVCHSPSRAIESRGPDPVTLYDMTAGPQSEQTDTLKPSDGDHSRGGQETRERRQSRGNAASAFKVKFGLEKLRHALAHNGFVRSRDLDGDCLTAMNSQADEFKGIGGSRTIAVLVTDLDIPVIGTRFLGDNGGWPAMNSVPVLYRCLTGSHQGTPARSGKGRRAVIVPAQRYPRYVHLPLYRLPWQQGRSRPPPSPRVQPRVPRSASRPPAPPTASPRHSSPVDDDR